MVILSKVVIYVILFCFIIYVCIFFIIYYRFELLNKVRKEGIFKGMCLINYLVVDFCFRMKGIGKILLNIVEKDVLRYGCLVSLDFLMIYSFRIV